MKIQLGNFIDKANKIANIVTSRMNKVHTNKENTNDNVVSEFGSKIYKIRKQQLILQSEISKRQHISEGIENIISFINGNENLDIKDMKNGIASIIKKTKYGNENLLNKYLISNVEIDNISSKEELKSYSKSLSEANYLVKNEISALTLNINELTISESNILSLNILNQNQLSSFIEDLKGDFDNIRSIHSSFDKDISKLLDY